RLGVWRLHAQQGLVLVHGGDVVLGDLGEGLGGFDRLADDLVVYISDVADIGDAQTRFAQPARDDVEAHQHACVPQVAIVVHRDAANIHADMAWLDTLERLLAAGKRVVYGKHAADGAEGCETSPVRWRGRRAKMQFSSIASRNFPDALFPDRVIW